MAADTLAMPVYRKGRDGRKGSEEFYIQFLCDLCVLCG
jgi:hypothetical protein